MALLGAGGRQRGAHAAVVVVVVMALTLAALARGTHAPPRHNNHDNHNNHPNHHSNKLGGSKGEASTAWRLVASSPSPVPLNDIAYGNGIFVGVGDSSTVVRSSDYGLTWSLVASPSIARYQAYDYVKFVNGSFVVWAFGHSSSGGETENALRSVDGVSWSASSVAFRDFAEGNELMLGVGMGADVGVVWAASSDEPQWRSVSPAAPASNDADSAEQPSPPELFVGSVYHAQLRVFGTIGAVLNRAGDDIANATAYLYTSSDLATWERSSAPLCASLSSIPRLAYSDTSHRFIVFTCDSIYTSSDGKSWGEAKQRTSQPPSAVVRDVACASTSGRCVAISTSVEATPCSSHPMWITESSDGGLTWDITCVPIEDPRGIPAKIVLGGVATDGDKVFTVAIGPYVLYSSRAEHWDIVSQQQPMPVDGIWYEPASETFLAGCTYAPGLLSSNNVVDWTHHNIEWQFREMITTTAASAPSLLIAIAAQGPSTSSNRLLYANPDALSQWDVVPQNADLSGALLYGLHYRASIDQIGCFAKLIPKANQTEAVYFLSTPASDLANEWNGQKLTDTIQPIVWAESHGNYIGTDQRRGTLVVSLDGVSWNATFSLSRGVQSLAVDGAGNVVALARCGIVTSPDAGRTWSNVQSWASFGVDGTEGQFSDVAYDTQLEAFVIGGSYAGSSTTSTTLVSYNLGRDWKKLEFPFTLATGALVAGAEHQTLLVVANALMSNATALEFLAYELPLEPLECNARAIDEPETPADDTPTTDETGEPDGPKPPLPITVSDSEQLPELTRQDVAVIVLLSLTLLALVFGALYHVALWRKHKLETGHLVDMTINGGEDEDGEGYQQQLGFV